MRVRVKELAQEARYIRLEENRLKSKGKIIMPYYGNYENKYRRFDSDKNSQDFLKLQSHRTNEVRNASRAIQLTYGFMRNVPYKRIESNSKPPSGYWEIQNWNKLVKEVKRLATKFGYQNFDDEIENWFKIE
jgi:hypothetical protein